VVALATPPVGTLTAASFDRGEQGALTIVACIMGALRQRGRGSAE